MAAPAGLVMAKMMMPETEKSETTDDISIEKDTQSVNIVDAAARGASDGLMLALNIGAMLLAFIALVALINGIIGFAGGLLDWKT